ncbi:MAG: aldo/keto reductase [Firmicutes bacterium]|nr:aldo/keto reductase [Bacillota bacterium]
MKLRKLGKTNVKVSEISLGTWQLGSQWGMPFSHDEAYHILGTAKSEGINCLDTADVYQGGLSEKTIGQYTKQHSYHPFVITKVGRYLPEQKKELYTEEALRKFVDASRKNMDVEALDMVLLHCPPTDAYLEPRIFKIMDQLVLEGKIKHYGVSVEKIEEAMMAMKYPGVEAIEVIFNMFRLKPAESFFAEAMNNNVGIIVRVPLASGLLTGKYHQTTKFNPDDHRTFNRNGEAFDKGETFSGVDYDLGLKAVNALKKLFNTENLAPIALRWILMFDAVSTVIPGASRAEQVLWNTEAAKLPPLTQAQMDGVEAIYNQYIKSSVHHLW